MLRCGVLSAGWLAIGRSVAACAAEADPGDGLQACPSDWAQTSSAVPAEPAAPDAGAPAASELFQHGVASGDPLPDGVILWTRVTPGPRGESVDVAWEIAIDPEFEQRVAGGTLMARPERDFTVKLDARGLEAGRTYYYRFMALGRTSPVGRTRTAPVGAVEHLRFGVVSCASLGHGYFHAYAALAQRLDLDAVIHLGDYLYEYAFGEWGVLRTYQPTHEATTLEDYRIRHAEYKRDPDLQEVHRQHPFIAVWDDHEAADNAWLEGAKNHMPGEGDWQQRKADAIRAYNEWMPIREQGCGRQVWRKQSFGELLDLVMLDTRHWARNRTHADYLGPPPAADPARQLLGDDQEQWLAGQLDGSRARWKIIGQQMMVADMLSAPGELLNLDQWHGYPEARARVLELLRRQPDGNLVVLTGDVHNAWACEIANDPAAHRDGGSVAVEFVTPSVTSPGGIYLDMQLNPELRWSDPLRHGYLVLDVTPERVQGAFCLLDAVEQPERPAETIVAWAVEHGQRILVQDAAPAAAKPNPPVAAP